MTVTPDRASSGRSAVRRVLDGVRDRTPPETAPVLARPRARLALALLTGAYVVTLSYLSVRAHHAYRTTGFDLGIFDQGVWLLSRGEPAFVTVRGLHLFGDHQSFVLLLLAPVYWLFPSVSALLVLQSAVLGSGAVATFLLARHALRAEWPAVACAAAYLAHPAVAWTNLDDIHPEAVEPPLVLTAFLLARTGRWRWFAACVVALLLVKEDVPLLTLGLGLYVAVRHHLRAGLALSALSLAWLLAALTVLIPAFNDAGSLYTTRVTGPYGGTGGLVRTFLTRPQEVLSAALAGGRQEYLWQLLGPLALLSLLAPSVLLVCALPLAAHLLSTFPYQHDIRYHYATLLVPVLVASAVLGIARFRRPQVRQGLALWMAATSVSSALLWGPFADPSALLPDTGAADVRSGRAALALVPPDAVVAGSYTHVPHLTHRTRVYEFPNPWRATNWGDYGLEGQRLPEAETVDHVLVTVAHLGPTELAVLRELEDGPFRRAFDRDGVVLLVRRPLSPR